MRCPNCGCTESKVIDSRPTENSSIRRRRECLNCQKRFTTYEIIDTGPLVVIKKDKKREIFDRNKIMTGLLKACYKRPVTQDQLNALVSDIETELREAMRTEVTSSEIGEMVMDRLRGLDEVSYVRFASVYRQFKDVETFMRELQEIKDKHDRETRAAAPAAPENGVSGEKTEDLENGSTSAAKT